MAATRSSGAHGSRKPLRSEQPKTSGLRKPRRREPKKIKNGQDTRDTGKGRNRQTVTQDSKLLALPAELRNPIYEMALIEDSPIRIEAEPDARLEIPGLLLACKSLREETLGIWYQSNQFVIEIDECDATALNKWTAHCVKVEQRDVDISIMLLDSPNWPNILQWCHAVWKDDNGRKMVKADGMHDLELAICFAHEIATTNKGRSWKACLTMLEDLDPRFFHPDVDGGWEPIDDDDSDDDYRE